MSIGADSRSAPPPLGLVRPASLVGMPSEPVQESIQGSESVSAR
jgi:hypothetical protein